MKKEMTVRRDMSGIPLYSISYKIVFTVEWDEELGIDIKVMRKRLRTSAYELLACEREKDIISGYTPDEYWIKAPVEHGTSRDNHKNNWLLEKKRWEEYWSVKITKAVLYRPDKDRKWITVKEGEEIEF